MLLLNKDEIRKVFSMRDAIEADKRWGIDFQKIWSGSRLNPVVRAGIGFDYSISENIAIGAEVNANMLPDHFNSKLGKNDNKDWHFNALIGLWCDQMPDI